MKAPLLADALPELAAEVASLLEQGGEPELAKQVPSLTVIDRCRWGDDFCATIYTAPPPKGAWGPGHRNVALDLARGCLILDVVDEKITCVEVLYRDEIRSKLLQLLS